jgi:hypothetical protein
MYVSTHLVTGAALGLLTGKLWSAFLIGAGSHIFLDMLPHSDYGDISSGIIDVICATLLLTYLYDGYRELPLIIGAIGGTLPDLEVAISFLRGRSMNFFPTHTSALPHGRAKSIWGRWGQILFIIFMVLLLSL